VGKVKTAHEARLATLHGGTDAHLLQSRGDFLAFGAGESALRFQVAHVGEGEIRNEVEKIKTAAAQSMVINAEPVVRR
jgi:hypothetical protein